MEGVECAVACSDFTFTLYDVMQIFKINFIVPQVGNFFFFCFKFYFLAFHAFIDRSVEMRQEMGGRDGGNDMQYRAIRLGTRTGAACSEDYSLNSWRRLNTAPKVTHFKLKLFVHLNILFICKYYLCKKKKRENKYVKNVAIRLGVQRIILR